MQCDPAAGLCFIHACLGKMSFPAAGLSYDSQASDQPDVAGRAVIQFWWSYLPPCEAYCR